MSIDLNKLAAKLATKDLDSRVQSSRLPLRIYLMLRLGAKARERSIGQHIQGALVPWAEKWWGSWEADIEALASQEGITPQEMAEKIIEELFPD